MSLIDYASKFQYVAFGLLYVTGPFWGTALFSTILFSRYYYLAIIYFTWILFDSWNLKRGGRLRPWARHLHLWKLTAKKMPVTFIKTANLDPKQNYIFGGHPHGYLPYGAGMSFMIYEDKFKKLFPGITVRMCVHNMFLCIPFMREFWILTGLCSVDKESIEYIITKLGAGNAAGIIVGGAKEFLATKPYTIELILKNRKGFVKIAIKHGVSLVPCLAFGENELLAEPNKAFDFVSNILRRWSSKGYHVQNFCAFFLAFFYIVFNLKTMFKRFFFDTHRVHTIIGKPIKVVKNDHPSDNEVNDIHRQYLNQITDLFHEHKKHVPNGDKYQLIIN